MGKRRAYVIVGGGGGGGGGGRGGKFWGNKFAQVDNNKVHLL